MRIDDRLIEDIRSRADIVQVISDCLLLKKSGRHFKTLCPFHKEKTPSFLVNPELQIFHCFGCGAGGNIFTFLMKYENIGFIEAIKKVAKYVSITIPENNSNIALLPIHKISKANQTAADYFQKMLYSSEGRIAHQYIKNRGATQKILEIFKIGYCGFNTEGLLEAGKKEALKSDDFELAGIIMKGQTNIWNMRFRNRLMFPIKDTQGNIVGFGGRSLDNSMDRPKYINSPQTPLYNKSKILYGLDVAKDKIRDKGFVLVVEGYMDMISVYQNGVGNVVASLGTSLTHDQIQALNRFTSKIVFSYDSDSAGQSATLRGLDIAISKGFKVNIMRLPENEDPDLFIQKQGKDKFLETVETSEDILDYRIRMARMKYPGHDLQDTLMVSNELLETIAQIENFVLRDLYITRLAEKLSISESAIRQQFAKISQKSQRIIPSDQSPTQISIAEKMFIGLALVFPCFRKNCKEQVLLNDIENQTVKDIFKLCIENEELCAASILGKIDEDKKGIISKIIQETSQIQDTEKAMKDTLNWFKKKKNRQNIIQSNIRLKEAHNKGEEESVKKIILDIEKLVKSKI